MMDDFQTVQTTILGAYFGILLMLSFYGSHRYLMVYLYSRHARGADPEPLARFADEDLPHVTVQLPLYNERYVCERLIEAVAKLDYPREKLEIQVLDDSTDDTTAIARERVDALRAEGLDICLIHRTDRTGYKAGALQAGMRVAKGEYLAVFDADFVPQADFLRQSIHQFTDDGVGMVQARWGHINREHSLLTRAQAVLLDGHFVIEHTARNRSGRFFNFNGTAGIWRKSTIEDAGGWEHDTLTEDLDLSYRAQLKGWRFVFLRDLVVPSELPVEVNAFKSQQHRWAKGSIQTAIKLLPRIMTSDQPLRVKIEAFYHLTANLAYLLLVCLAFLMPVATYVRIDQGWIWFLAVDLPIFLGATFSICLFYWRSQAEQGRSWGQVWRLIPAVLGIGIGISVNNAKAVLEALVGYQTAFVRTPKYGDVEGSSWASKLYIRRARLMPVVELGLGAWFTGSIVIVLMRPHISFYSLPFLMLFQFGFFYIATLSIVQSLQPILAARKIRGA